MCLKVLEHPSGPFMLCSGRKPFYMHWNLPTGGPKRRAITSLTERRAPRWICEWGIWPPPTLTPECCSGCEYEIQPLKVERVNLSPPWTSKGRACESEPGLYSGGVCRLEVVSGLQADGRDYDMHSVSRGGGGGGGGADWVGQVVWLCVGMWGTRRARLCLVLTWCYMCCFFWACCGM